MNIPETLQALFSDKDQDVMAIYVEEEVCIKAWKVDRIKEAARNVKATEVELARLNPKLGSWFGDIDSSLSLSELVPHIERVQSADTSFPIIVFGEDRIIDGAHRFLRALLEEKETIPCKMLTVLPTPDMVIPLSSDGQSISFH